MSIPPEILAVNRPKYTIVKAYGANKDKFLVIYRGKNEKVNGKFRPPAGKTIGHIINGEYVSLTENLVQTVSMKPTDIKTFGIYALADTIFKDILQDLKKFYTEEDALKIYTMAILRVCSPGISDHRLKVEYNDSFLSEFYPDIPLCRNTVSVFLGDLGRSCLTIRNFMKYRCSMVNEDNHLIIDGTLKTNDSTVNSFSNWSRKARLKGRKDISILYAYNQETREPVCSQCFPGNMLDSTAYCSFLTDNGIEKGVVVVDKGFSIKNVSSYYRDHPTLHFLNPLKRGTALADQYNLYKYAGTLKLESDGPTDEDGAILYQKKEYELNGAKRWLYSFKDIYIAMEEEKIWTANIRKGCEKIPEDSTFDAELEREAKKFGTIIMESDLDLSPEEAYRIYDSRWDIEIMMRFYKTACEFDTTNEHDDYSVMGSEFINFLSVLLTYRLKNLFHNISELENCSYVDVMDDLRRIKKIRQSDGTWAFTTLLEKQTHLLEATGLIDKPVPRKRGRPKKVTEDVESTAVRKKRGRPRIHPVPDPDAPKRKRGRPRTRPIPDPNMPKRKRGRPKKNAENEMAI